MRTTLTHKIKKHVCGITVFAAGIMLAAAESRAAGWVIDFEEFINGNGDRINAQHGQIADDEYANQILSVVGDDSDAGVGVTISAVNNANSGHDEAVIFNTRLTGTRDSDLEDPFTRIGDGGDTYEEVNGHKAGNILILQEHDTGSCGSLSCSRPDDEGNRYSNKSTGFFQFDFTVPVDLTSIDFFDVEAEENGTDPHNEILFFDETLQAIGPTLHTPDTGGDNKWARLTFNVTGVKRLIVELRGSGGIDRIAGDITNPPDNVPEADGAAVLGIGMVGLLAARRRKQASGQSAE